MATGIRLGSDVGFSRATHKRGSEVSTQGRLLERSRPAACKLVRSTRINGFGGVRLRNPFLQGDVIPRWRGRSWVTLDRGCFGDVSKRRALSPSAALDDVPHLSDWLPDLPSYPNPLHSNPAYSSVEQYFVDEEDVVLENIVLNVNQDPSQIKQFRRAGPRSSIVFDCEEVRAAIVTCGGLCPGLNTVIRELVSGLWGQYGVRDILGIEGGYRGFYARNVISLNPKIVSDIHKKGGTILGTSRGGHETTKIVNAIEDRGINQVYIIGGDGTQRGADVIHREVMRRGLKVAVAGIPKTIDNDIAVIDKSFGFDTAVEEAQRAINAAHVEAESVQNGVGLVKLMGRYSGYIAMYATLASRDVDCCLIPEIPFYLHGPGGLFEFVKKKLRENGHIVLVVAEGAGQELIAESMDDNTTDVRDASGNRLLLDVGLWLSQQLKETFLKEYREVVNLKYIDPTYMIRAIPSNASDNVYCTLLAHSAIHGAMAGFTGFTVGPVNNRHCYIPIARVTEKPNKVNVGDRMWARLLSSTQQPSFIRPAQTQTETGYGTRQPYPHPIPEKPSNGNVFTEPAVPVHRLDAPAVPSSQIDQKKVDGEEKKLKVDGEEKKSKVDGEGTKAQEQKKAK